MAIEGLEAQSETLANEVKRLSEKLRLFSSVEGRIALVRPDTPISSSSSPSTPFASFSPSSPSLPSVSRNYSRGNSVGKGRSGRFEITDEMEKTKPLKSVSLTPT